MGGWQRWGSSLCRPSVHLAWGLSLLDPGRYLETQGTVSLVIVVLLKFLVTKTLWLG